MSKNESLSEEEANELVLEHRGWAESIARSVARAWNLDWQLDGLDGAAMEALIFCSRRFNPSMGVPFRGYARKRIHEASSDAARQSRGWRKSGSSSKAQAAAREVSVELLSVFPELRSGFLPGMDEDSGNSRDGIRQLLMGASLIAARQGSLDPGPDEIMDYKKMVRFVVDLEPVHQEILWKVYWEGHSMRSVASDWETDELNVIREHKVLLEHLHKCVSKGKANNPIRVRPGLKDVAAKLRRENEKGPFERLISKESIHG